MNQPLITFQNPGLIPIEAITTAGVSAKDTDDAIGEFGTGLKYAICTILRLGGSITIYRGLQPLSFQCWPSEIRGKTFQIVHLDNGVDRLQPLGFTLDYGKNWAPWMAYRELHSNTLDEQGVITSEHLEPAEGMTTIYVRSEPLFEAGYCERENIFLTGKADWHSERGSCIVEIHDRPSQHFYFRGIKAGTFARRPPFTFNILGPKGLTEDRTYDGLKASRAVGMTIPLIDDAYFQSKLMPSHFSADEKPGDRFIDMLDMDWAQPASDAFIARCETLFARNIAALPTSARNILRRHRPEPIEAPANLPLSVVQQKMLDKAKNYLHLLGYRMEDIERYPIHMRDLGETCMGLADREQQLIVLGTLAFEHGTKQVCSTLHEEFVHLHHGLNDLTYSMQTHLFNQIASLMEEHVFKEPL